MGKSITSSFRKISINNGMVPSKIQKQRESERREHWSGAGNRKIGSAEQRKRIKGEGGRGKMRSKIQTVPPDLSSQIRRLMNQ